MSDIDWDAFGQAVKNDEYYFPPKSLAEKISAIEFNFPFTISGGEVFTDGNYGLYVPGVYIYEMEDGSWSDEGIESGDWEFVSGGFTGQYSYNGPVMHSSEHIGDTIANYLAGIAVDYEAFAVVVVESIAYDDDDSEPAGWAIIGKPF